MLEIGINSNNECGDSILEICKNIKQAGFNNVMIAFKSANAEESLKAAKDLGLKVPFVHLKTSYANDLWVKGSTNEKYIKDIIEQIKICSKYKVPIAVLHGTNGSGCEIALPPTKHAIDSMNIILQAAQKYNVKIALENLDNANFRHFTFLLDNIKSPWLGLCYDAGHHQLYAPKFDILKRYGNRILAIHLHDNLMDWQKGYDYSKDLHILPFDGKINYTEICSKLAKTGYNNVVMLEVHKESWGLTQIYDKVSIKDYLKEAKTRADKLAKMIEDIKNKG